MTPEELCHKLDELRALPAETEWTEFKASYANSEDIGEYISALSNAAALLGQPRGYIVWGVENGTHKIIGTTFKPRKQKGAGNEDLEPWLTRLIAPRIDFTIHEFLAASGEHIVMFEVQA